MRIFAAIGLGLLGAMAASPVLALSITNEDPDAQTVVVTKGSDSKTITVDPQKKVDADCTDGCVVELEETGEQYEMHGQELISIVDGVIYVDDDPTIEAPTDIPPPPDDAAEAK